MEVRSILVRAPNWIGDQVLAFPFFFYLRHAYPKARIVSACVTWVKDIQFQGLVDEVFTLRRPPGSSLFDKFAATNESAAELSKIGPFDLGISLPNSFSAAWLLYRAGVKRRRGYHVDARGLLLNDRLKWNQDPSIHRAQSYLSLLPPERVPQPRIEGFWTIRTESEVEKPVPGILDAFDAPAFWKPTDTLEPPSEPYFVIAPGATADSRRWPPEYFAKLATLFWERTKARCVIVGGPTEAPLATIIEKKSEAPVTDLTGQCRVSGLWKVFSNAKFTVSNESGLAHVAALCGSDVHIVCGAANPSRTAPTGPGRVKVSINPVDCWPCERNICSQPPGQKVRCLLGIEPVRVSHEIFGESVRESMKGMD